MNDKYIWTIIVTAVLTIMLYFNRKVRLFALIKEQMLVFKNDKYRLPAAAEAAVQEAYQNLLSGSTVEAELKKIDEAFESNKDKIELVEN